MAKLVIHGWFKSRVCVSVCAVLDADLKVESLGRRMAKSGTTSWSLGPFEGLRVLWNHSTGVRDDHHLGLVTQGWATQDSESSWTTTPRMPWTWHWSRRWSSLGSPSTTVKVVLWSHLGEPHVGQIWASQGDVETIQRIEVEVWRHHLFWSISIVRLELLLDAPSPLWATLFNPLWAQFPSPSWTQFASSLHGLLQLPVHRGLASDFEFHSTSPCFFPLPTQQALDSEINEIHRRMPQEEGQEEPPYGRTQWPVLIFDVNVMGRWWWLVNLPQ